MNLQDRTDEWLAQELAKLYDIRTAAGKGIREIRSEQVLREQRFSERVRKTVDMIDLLKRLEWAGTTRGPGTSQGSRDGTPHGSCVICGGIKTTRDSLEDFIAEALGHRATCDLDAAIRGKGKFA